MEHDTIYFSNTGTNYRIESERCKISNRTVKKRFPTKRKPTEYLTRNEVKDLLKCGFINGSQSGTKRGKLRAYGIAGRVYYKRHEVEQSIKPLNF